MLPQSSQNRLHPGWCHTTQYIAAQHTGATPLLPVSRCRNTAAAAPPSGPFAFVAGTFRGGGAVRLQAKHDRCAVQPGRRERNTLRTSESGAKKEQWPPNPNDKKKSWTPPKEIATNGRDTGGTKIHKPRKPRQMPGRRRLSQVLREIV